MTAIDDLLTDWTTAERTGDAATLAGALTDDFAGIGPLGFVLSKQAWLRRFQEGLSYDRFELEDVQRRDYSDAAIVTARQIASGRMGDHPLPFAAVLATLVLIRRHDLWQLATVHTSLIAGTPGAPPLPVPARQGHAADPIADHG